MNDRATQPPKRSAIIAPFLLGLLFLLQISSPANAQNGLPGPASSPADAATDPTPQTSNVITLDFKDAEISTVLRVLSIKSGVNIVAGPEVQGTVTIRLENVPWEKALEVLLRTYDYVYERDDNVIRVTTRDKMAQEPVVTQTYILNYTKAVEIQTAVKDMLTERGRIQIAERTNTIVITDIPTNLYRIGEVIKSLDKVTPQAFIDSKVVRTDVGVTENLGTVFNPTGTISGAARPTTFPFSTSTDNNNLSDNLGHGLRQFFPITGTGENTTVNSNDLRGFPLNPVEATTGTGYAFGTLSFASFSATMQYLRSKSNTKVVSNPRVSVLNNQTAKVQVGEQIPLPTFARNQTTGAMEVTGYSYRDVGVVLNVTPHINSEEEILVDLKPEVSSQGDNVNFGSFQIPSFTVTQAITQLLIRSGETIAIGGLLTDNTQISEAKIPYLGDLPLVGKLFRSKRQTAGTSNQKTETLFFVTVTMVDTENQPMGSNAKGYVKADEESAQAQQPGAAEPKVETLPQASVPESQDSTALPNPSQSASGLTSNAITSNQEQSGQAVSAPVAEAEV